jgi:DNA-directed RNA polymerase specialized sigma24 family protein
MSVTNTIRGSQKRLDGDSALFDTRFWRSYRLLHFIACRILDDPEQAKKAVENCWHSASARAPHFEHEGAFRGWLVRVLIDEALLLFQKSSKLLKRTCRSRLLARGEIAWALPRATFTGQVSCPCPNELPFWAPPDQLAVR